MFRKIPSLFFIVITIAALVWPTGSVSAAQAELAAPTRWITISTPNGGEVLSVGSIYRIKWKSSSNINRVSIGYKSCDSCLNWIVTNIPNVGFYDWTVFVGNTTRTQFRIQVIGYQTGIGSVTDYSDANFTINPRPTPTRTPTKTRIPTKTPTYTKTPTAIKTSTNTNTPTITNTPTVTNTPTWTPTDLPTDTPTATPTDQPTDTPTPTPTPILLPMGSGTGLIGEYFDNDMDIDGAPLYTRLDPQVLFNWSEPVAENVPDDFTARWTGQIEARSSEEYVFSVDADDLARLWIDGQLYIDYWDDPADGNRFSPAITLLRGQKYDIQIDFRDIGGGASISLNWYTLSGSIAWEVVPMEQLYPSPNGLPATATPTPTETPSPTPTATDTRTSTSTRTPTPTRVFTNTPTSTYTRTNTPVFTNTNTPVVTPTRTFTNTPTSTYTRTFTNTPTSTPPATFTNTPTPTSTRTNTPTSTVTRTFTNTATQTLTPTPTSTFTNTFTPIPSGTPAVELLPPGIGIGLTGQYFNNDMDINGVPLHEQIDPQINFSWGDYPGVEEVASDFTVRWTGQIEARSSEEYVLYVDADDLAHVWIDGELYIDYWDDPVGGDRFGPAILLTAGQMYDIQIDFRDTGGGASIVLYWYTLSGSIELEVIPMQQLYPFRGLPSSPTLTPTPTYTPPFTAVPTSTVGFTPTPVYTPALFEPYVNYPVGDGEAIGISDFNNDGLKDVALAIPNQLLIFLQGMDGALASPIGYPALARPVSLAVGDLNHDGLTDIALLFNSSNTISVYLQQADGTLAARVTYPTNDSPDSLAIGDVNNDGLVDIAVSHWNAGNIGILTQNTNGTMNPMVSYTSPQAGYDDIAIGDVNGDGLNDVVKMNGQGLNPNLSVYLQNMNGTLSSATPYSLGCSCNSNGLGIGDVTGDGLADVVLSYGGNRPSSNIAVFAQTSGGVLGSPLSHGAYDIPEPLEIADVNSDGFLDVLIAHGGWNTLSVYLQQNDGVLHPYSRYSIPDASHYSPQGLAIGDINNDGLPDVAIADSNHGLVILYHVNPLTPTHTPTYIATSTHTATPTLTNTPDFTHTVTPTATPTDTPLIQE